MITSTTAFSTLPSMILSMITISVCACSLSIFVTLLLVVVYIASLMVATLSSWWRVWLLSVRLGDRDFDGISEVMVGV